MEFEDTPQEAAFRAEARAWIAANAPAEVLAAVEATGVGTLALGVDSVPAQKAWQRTKYEAGWACLHWPRAYGGRGATPVERLIWLQEEDAYARLSSVFHNGQGMCGPTLIAHAAEDQKRELLPKIASGEEIWCQLFSEPGAGSDLAGVRTRAVRDGDGWIVRGQKLWTSGAQVAQWGLLLARTDGSVPKHQGLTMFFLDMASPGVEVRPVRQMNDQYEFNEVFLSDVRVPDRQRLGPVGGGWGVALTTLMNERLSIGLEMPTGLDDLMAFCRAVDLGDGPAIDDPSVRERLADWAVQEAGLRFSTLRAVSGAARGQQPGAGSSMIKLVAGAMMQEIAAFAVEIGGPAGLLTDPAVAPHLGRFAALLLRAPGTRIEGGTDEILRNIIAERVLGLPPEPRSDKTVPFDEIQRG
ncbi:acyl-CoA dehydrogenase family protein [Phenylobacterium sp.]|uniref:acyl-CoA dehydrogenase family protein n=1 Tax=Phenylobacterium sp. TaxID=1871053 RepID=UPI0025CBBA95|nr:acyl-CoA dehydrogenase family protein [Phenylobacterium sp.]MBX3485793.1 acyl-CoA dehydrogenase family protein [Phenylobacterium sp.]